MNTNCILILATTVLTTAAPLRAQVPAEPFFEPAQPVTPAEPVTPAQPLAPAEPVAAPAPGTFEAMPTLDASVILQPQYYQGANFTVQNAVPTYSGSNAYTINSDFGVFQANGNAMLMRRVAEINGIAQLSTMSQTDEFASAAKKAAESPLNVAQDLVTDPVSTISSVPKGIWGFLNRAGQGLKEAAEGRQSDSEQGNVVSNLTGFSKTKRDIAIKLGVDPYTTNEVFQKELNKVAWPAFMGSFTVNLGMAAVTGGAGTALSGLNMTATLQSSLRDKSPVDLRLMNLGLLMNNMGVARADADAFLNNNAISPTTQTCIVDALGQLGNIPGQAEFIREATGSEDELDALSFQNAVQIMANINQTAPIARITHVNGLPICQTNDGTVIVPIRWDYAAWTPMTAQFIKALKARKFEPAATGYTVVMTGVVSPMAAAALAAEQVNVTTKALPGPLR